MDVNRLPSPGASLVFGDQILTEVGLGEEEKEHYLLSFNEELEKPPLDSFRWYLALHRLPQLRLGPTAPPLSENGHKLHLNKLSVAPAAHRHRFNTIMPRGANGRYDRLTLAFCLHVLTAVEHYDTTPQTGYELTLATKCWLPSINSFQDFNTWLSHLPFQTLTRAMHIGYYDRLRDWNVTAVPHALHVPASERTAQNPDPDSEIWRTYVYRKSPQGVPDFNTYYSRETPAVDMLGECKVVFAVQPPWILSEADIEAFRGTEMIPPYNETHPSLQPIYTSGQRIWAKLWDQCVKYRCHHWVLTSYQRWVFGVFSEGYSAGQILFCVGHDKCAPTVLQCLVFHVASAMGLTENPLIRHPEPIEFLKDITDEVPVTMCTEDMEYPDSGSEWEGMDTEPGVSAGVSEYCFSSAVSVCGPIQKVNSRRPVLSRKRSSSILAWTEKVSHMEGSSDIQELSTISLSMDNDFKDNTDNMHHAVPSVVLQQKYRGVKTRSILAIVPENQDETAAY